MKLVITEKPSVAASLAKVFGAGKRHEGYLEGNGFVFTWAFGHLVQLAAPEHYGFKSWSVDNLPMLPKKFELVVKQKERKDDSGAKKQLKVISSLFKSANEIIVATDAGREGELIFRNIYLFSNCKKPFKRLWISSQTDKAIKEGFAALKDGKQYDGLYEAARLRSESDWLVGMNGTQALSLAAGTKDVFSLGRVQTPTLVLICERYLENKNFVPVTFFQIVLQLDKNGVKFQAVSAVKWDTRESAEQRLNNVRTKQRAYVANVDVKEKNEPTPLLFDLTSLQQEANRRYGFSADKTLNLAQELYEGKLITYPRTGSRYIGEDVFEEVPSLIKLLVGHRQFGSAANYLLGKELSKRSVNGSKVTDHHALLITENMPVTLGEDQKHVYDLVAGRMLESFHETCKKEITTAILDASESFMAKGTVVIYPGWRSVLGEIVEEGEDEESSALPKLIKGDLVHIDESNVVEKQTAPKKLLTEATLLKAMETCGRDIDDDEAREAMKDSGLGTPATRAQIITTLFDRNYIVRQKKSLVPTEKGLFVYDLVKDKSIGKPVMTGEWEKMLSRIERGRMEAKEFESGILDYTKRITNEFLTIKPKAMSESEIIRCPKCNSGTISFVNRGNLDGAVCSQKREDCGFIVFRTIAKKNLSDELIKDLIVKGKTAVIDGFVSAKTGNKFSAALKLDESFKVVFDFEKK